MNNIQWGDVATWLAAIGTLGAFAVGFIQINNERKIRKRKENEEKKQEIINQAEHVSAWVAKERQSNALLSILNQSTDPIYEVIVSIVAFQGAGAKDAKILHNNSWLS